MSTLGHLVRRARELVVSQDTDVEQAILLAVDELAESAPGPIQEADLQV